MSDEEPEGNATGVPKPIRVACAVVLLEAAGLVAAGLFLVLDTLLGSANGVGRALFGAVFAFVGAAVLGVGARGLVGLRPAARTPVIVLQLLALPVSYSLAIQAGRVAWGGPILIAAVAVIYLLFTPPARAALDREPPA